MKTEIVYHQEFLDFIFSQPREREINMAENVVTNDSDCGCMMVHFARNKGLTGGIHAGYYSISLAEDEEDRFVLDREIKYYFPHHRNGFAIHLTYGEVQDFLTEKGQKPSK